MSEFNSSDQVVDALAALTIRELSLLDDVQVNKLLQQLQFCVAIVVCSRGVSIDWMTDNNRRMYLGGQ